MTAALANFLNRDYKVSWRDGQLTTKSSWVGSLAGTQVFATVERNVTSSGEITYAFVELGQLFPKRVGVREKLQAYREAARALHIVDTQFCKIIGQDV